MLKEEVSMFISENTCALVDLFDKTVSCQEGARPNTENEVATLRRDKEM